MTPSRFNIDPLRPDGPAAAEPSHGYTLDLTAEKGN